MKVIHYFAGDTAASGRARLYLHELVEFDIEHEPDLRRQFQSKAPVVKIGPYTLESPFTKLDLQVALGAARGSDRTDSSGEADRPWARPGNPGFHFFHPH